MINPPTTRGLYWARFHGRSGFHAIVRVIGDAPFLEVLKRYMDAENGSHELHLMDIEEFGPRIDIPEGV